MFLYKIEIEMADRQACFIVAAESDEKAFDCVEAAVARHYVASPEIKQAAIVEKKRIAQGSGYLIETGGMTHP
jgi:hypothetical protein